MEKGDNFIFPWPIKVETPNWNDFSSKSLMCLHEYPFLFAQSCLGTKEKYIVVAVWNNKADCFLENDKSRLQDRLEQIPILTKRYGLTAQLLF